MLAGAVTLFSLRGGEGPNSSPAVADRRWRLFLGLARFNQTVKVVALVTKLRVRLRLARGIAVTRSAATAMPFRVAALAVAAPHHQDHRERADENDRE
jgi:hypothetical protein